MVTTIGHFFTFQFPGYLRTHYVGYVRKCGDCGMDGFEIVYESLRMKAIRE